MTKHTTFLGLGSNMGNRKRNLMQAITKIRTLIGNIVCQSTFLVSEPWGYRSTHRYLNACVKVETELSPRELLDTIKSIEQQMGRTTHSVKDYDTGVMIYADRPIDIDILLYDDIRIDEPDLIIPHPLMFQRPFVMQPLSEICDEETLRQAASNHKSRSSLSHIDQ